MRVSCPVDLEKVLVNISHPRVTWRLSTHRRARQYCVIKEKGTRRVERDVYPDPLWQRERAHFLIPVGSIMLSWMNNLARKSWHNNKFTSTQVLLYLALFYLFGFCVYVNKTSDSPHANFLLCCSAWWAWFLMRLACVYCVCCCDAAINQTAATRSKYWGSKI